MAVPASRQDFGFVYCWTDHLTNKLYVGSHKGTVDDGYICSSQQFLVEHSKRPHNFTRQIIATGELTVMRSLERAILKSIDAARHPMFYNRHNAGKEFFNDRNSEQTRTKMSQTWKRKGVYNCDYIKANAAWRGCKQSDEARAIMRQKGAKHSAARRTRMLLSNPMKNPDTVKQMLETRRKNKELTRGT
jgi:hypothetical protein